MAKLTPGTIRTVSQAVNATISATSKAHAAARTHSTAYGTEVYSYFTRATGQTELMYEAKTWVRVKLELETAGPVAVGTSASLSPVLSGHGRLLNTSREYEVTLAAGTRLYVVAETVNRISVTIEPVPWLDQISTDIVSSAAGVRNMLASVGSAIVNAIAGLRGRAQPTSSSGKTLGDMPCPPPTGGLLPRLTTLRPLRRPR